MDVGGGEDDVAPPPDPLPAPIVDAAHAVDRDGKDESKRDWRAAALNLSHAFTHMPKNPYCASCQCAKMQRKLARRRGLGGTTPTKFGEEMVADYIVSHSDEAMGLTGERDALVILDRGSDYKDCFPLLTKDADDAYGAFVEFLGKRRAGYAWTDSAKELIKALKDVRIPHGKATPGRHTANAICERPCGRLLKGRGRCLSTPASPLASGRGPCDTGALWTTPRSVLTATRRGPRGSQGSTLKGHACLSVAGLNTFPGPKRFEHSLNWSLVLKWES